MLKKLRAALSSTEGKLKAVLLVSGIAILMLIFTVGALALTSTPTFCKSCHEMGPEYYTWQASDHNKISCVSCHIPPGAKSFVAHKIDSLSQLYYHFTGSYVTPIVVKDKIPNSQCEQCHDLTKRVATPSGDIKFPHTTHLDKGVLCVTCHSGVVHGSIEEKGFTAMGDFKKWNSYVGAAYVSSNYTKLPMTQCIECHQLNNAPTTCETCHTKIVKPDNHKDNGWLTAHGPLAQKDITSCNRCHVVTLEYGKIPTDNFTAKDYARANTFCAACHVKKPAGHDDKWKGTHPQAATANKSGCYVCHDDTPPRTDNTAPSSLYCSKCHYEKHASQPFHPIPIPPSGYNAAVCGTCHNKKVCENCHVST